MSPTPGSVRINKSRIDLQIACSKEGFKTASAVGVAAFTGSTFGNLLAGGLVGIVVDAASGANNRYPADIRLSLSPDTASAIDKAALLTNDVPTAATQQNSVVEMGKANPPASAWARQFECPKPSTNFILSNGNNQTAIGQTEFDCTFADGRTRRNITSRGYFAAASAAPAFSAAAVALWPLEVNKETNAHWFYNGQEFTGVFKVLALEKVSVSAGTYSAWHVELSERRGGEGSADLKVDYWWSPEAAYVVKRNARIIRGAWGSQENYELVFPRRI